MITRILSMTAIVIFSSASFAQELYGTNNLSLRETATPGEIYFDDGVKAVKDKDYVHAVSMYKVAASWAYKPAEYNLGVIFARGEGGIPVDLPLAYAWLTLAAERGDKHYVDARDRVKPALDDAALKQSDVLLADMRPTYGDEVALVRAKSKWREVLAGATGSHVGYTGDNMQVGEGVSFRGNPTSVTRTSVGAGHGRGAVLVGSGITGSADVIGASGTQSSTAYEDLHATDNPYDPRFSAGVVTVGEVKDVGPQKSDANKTDKKKTDDKPPQNP